MTIDMISNQMPLITHLQYVIQTKDHLIANHENNDIHNMLFQALQ